MPANLPPQFMEVERRLKTAKSPEEKIAIMEELLSIIPKHKGTEKLQAMYKTKIAKLRVQAQKKPTSRHNMSFYIEKAGAGQIILIGLPNSGKSSLIKALTNAEPEIGSYPFTTHSSAPAMMPYENIQIQLIDTPPISPDYFEFWQAEQIKSAEGAILLLDLSVQDPGLDYLAITEKLEERRIRLVPQATEGIQEEGFFSISTLLLANKQDAQGAPERLAELADFLQPTWNIHTVSAATGKGLEDLKLRIFRLLDILRVYSKIPGKKASQDEPFIFKRGSTVMDMARAVHRAEARNGGAGESGRLPEA